MTANQIQQVWENCPKATSKLVEWFKAQLPKPIGRPEIDVPMQQAFKDAEKSLQVSMGASTPRFLYEFFDENFLHINLSTGLENEVVVWRWEIYLPQILQVVEEKIGYFKQSRKQAEEEAFCEAFEQLEKKLDA